ncbi:MAG: peptide deformylase [Chloroflexi bacterium RBG_13_46_14]|nr:MAG: peptide deformylase [Chloroflexi bacterium RBG_13_46_14]
MAVLPIRKAPDPVLRQKAKRVRTINASIHKLINDMLETMHDAPGVGLAAPQIGIPLRVIVIGIPEQEDFALINPEVVKTRGERVVNEGCLSIPGYMGKLKRAESVTVKGRDPSGKEVRIKAEELLAQALEHEIDHVNGILYTDRLESEDDLKKIEQKDLEETEF